MKGAPKPHPYLCKSIFVLSRWLLYHDQTSSPKMADAKCLWNALLPNDRKPKGGDALNSNIQSK